MHYHCEDIAKLLTGVPTWALTIIGRLEHYLSHAVHTGHELASVLAQYPAVRYEPLDFHYTCLQSLAVLDDVLVVDLLAQDSWTAVLWGAFLICLNPQPQYGPLLAQVRARTAKRAAVLTAAEAALGAPPSENDQQVLAAVAALRVQLAQCARPSITLRRAPATTDARAFQAKVRTAYCQHGADAALALIHHQQLLTHD